MNPSSGGSYRYEEFLPTCSCQDLTGTTACTSAEKADVFNRYFHSVFARPVCPADHPLPVASNIPIIPALNIQQEDVRKELSSLNPSKSSGPDNIPARLLKEGASEIAPSLAKIFQLSLHLERVPSVWKDVNVVPLHKRGDKSDAKNYRPISLTSVVSKVMERMVRQHLYDHLSTNGLVSDTQHGFRPGRSCESQLLDSVHVWYKSMEGRKSVDVLFLDMSKAFDRVPHTYLLDKLRMMGVDGVLLSWLRDYLSSRRQRCIVEGCASGWLPVSSGVPQGTILGPLLFLLYVNDIADNLNSKVALFADDCVLYREVQTKDDQLELQNDLNKIFMWSTKWKMSFNPEKCKLLQVGRIKRQSLPPLYFLDGQELPAATEHKHLGVTLTSKLCWSCHIDKTVAKARKVWGVIQRTTRGASVFAKLPLYKSLVVPLLEYASPVWSPHTKKDIQKLEKVQRHVTKAILGYQEIDYETRLCLLGLDYLEDRRKIKDLTTCYKYMNGFIDVDRHHFSPSHFLRTRSHNDSKLQVHFCRTNYFLFSFFNRVVTSWNSLPNFVVSAQNPNLFKKHLLLYFTRLSAC